MGNIWSDYDRYLEAEAKAGKDAAKRMSQASLGSIARNSAMFQDDAKVNGASKPLLAVRTKTREIELTALNKHDLFIGDYVDCFGEKWLIVEMFTNENDTSYGKAWLCNHLFKYQNNSPEIIKKWGVVDTGGYGAGDDKALPVETGYFNVYMALDDQTKKIYKDKRFSMGIQYDKTGKEILDVVEVVWVDQKSKNAGRGSHLLSMRVTKGEYNDQTDSFANGICNYIAEETTLQTPETPLSSGKCIIVGGNTQRLKTTRSQSVIVIDNNGDVVDTSDKTFVWLADPIDEVECDSVANGAELAITVGSSYSLLGKVISLSVVDENGDYVSANKRVEVVE